jgi:hypothetical protein
MSPRKAPRENTDTTAILLRGFPIPLHKAMKVAAIQQGRRVTELYAEACTLFLRAAGTRKGGERS